MANALADAAKLLERGSGIEQLLVWTGAGLRSALQSPGERQEHVVPRRPAAAGDGVCWLGLLQTMHGMKSISCNRASAV
jgi:hypothetical protein